MAGYIIHIAIAQEYLKKHNRDYDIDFIRGSVIPDFTCDKSQTHYGKSPAYTNLKGFLNKNEVTNSKKEGEFLHLVTDYLFYNYYLKLFNKEDLHHDYDILNKNIIDKYDVSIIEEIKDKVYFADGNVKVLNLAYAYKIIDEISNLDIYNVIHEVKENNKKWFYYNNLI